MLHRLAERGGHSWREVDLVGGASLGEPDGLLSSPSVEVVGQHLNGLPRRAESFPKWVREQ